MKKFRVLAQKDDDIYFCTLLCESQDKIQKEFDEHMKVKDHGYKITKIEEVQVANFGMKINAQPVNR